MKEQIQSLQQQFDNTDDFGERMEIRDKILELKMASGEIVACSSEEECVGCGS